MSSIIADGHNVIGNGFQISALLPSRHLKEPPLARTVGAWTPPSLWACNDEPRCKTQIAM